MESILKDISAIVGVTGSFVCDDEGEVLARLLPNVFDETPLSQTARTIAQTIAGLEITRRRTIGDLDLVYEHGRLIAKSMSEGCLCILCVRHINVPLLNLTANMASKKLAQKIKQQTFKAEVLSRPESALQAQPKPRPELVLEGQPEPIRRMTRAEVMAASLRSHR